MTFDELKEKARSLPYEPGVYLMKDKADKVIYVGKAKKLKNRVSQYFQDTVSHSPKTKMMVSKIHHFDVIMAASEFEALVLECSLIKRHLPKYNILLKDDKGYPYIRLDMSVPYPKMELVSKLSKDKACYFGPFGSRGITVDLMDTIQEIFKLPSCAKVFPRDTGKGRVCLNYHMGKCAGWCAGGCSQQEYFSAMEQVKAVLSGEYKTLSQQLRKDMLSASERLDFEAAARLRDKLQAVEALRKKQNVTAGNLADTDVIGYGQTETKACFAVLHFRSGNLLDKEYEIFPVPDDRAAAVASLIKQFYLSRGLCPKRILLPMELEDMALISELFSQQLQQNTKLIVPKRGDNATLVELANKNAMEEAVRLTDKDEKLSAVVSLFGKLIGVENPFRIESYDISHIAGTDIVAGMIVFEDGRPKKSQYKRFKLQNMDNQNDYGAMKQVLLRRFHHFINGDKGFDEKPDLLLIDGGVAHANVALQSLRELKLNIPIFGMVKDNKHHTRALVTPQGMELAIDTHPSVFAFVGSIQEETHRFAISYHKSLRSKRLRYSALDEIPGIGDKRKQELLKTFRSIKSIAQATLLELERILPKDAAGAVYHHFHQEE